MNSICFEQSVPLSNYFLPNEHTDCLIQREREKQHKEEMMQEFFSQRNDRSAFGKLAEPFSSVRFR